MLRFHAAGVHLDTESGPLAQPLQGVLHACHKKIVSVLLPSPPGSSPSPKAPHPYFQHESNVQALIVIGPVDTLY